MTDNRIRWRIESQGRIVAIGKFDGAITFALICRIAAHYDDSRVFLNDRELVNFGFIRDTFIQRETFKRANPNQRVIHAAHTDG